MFNFTAKTIYTGLGRCISVLLALAICAMGASAVWMYAYSNTTAIGAADIYWVFYLHIVATAIALGCYLLMALSGIGVVFFNLKLWAVVVSQACAPTGFLMTVFAIVAGALFGRPMWGQYWVWDSRLTALLILLIFFFAFLTLSASRVSFERERNLRRASISSLVGLFIISGCFLGFDLFSPMVHDLDNSLIRSNGLDAQVLMTLYSLMLGFYALAMIFARSRTVILERQRRAVWALEAALEGTL